MRLELNDEQLLHLIDLLNLNSIELKSSSGTEKWIKDNIKFNNETVDILKKYLLDEFAYDLIEL